jgi:hypothetical protein
MSYTSVQTIKEVLRELSVLDATDAVSAEDSARVSDLLVPVALDLSTRRIVAIADTNAVPDLYFRGFIEVLAQHAAARFGKERDDAKLAAAEARLAAEYRLDRTLPALTKAVLERLEALGLSTPAIDAVSVDAVTQSVIDDLAARRIAVLVAVGSQQFPHVVTLVAARLQPKSATAEMLAGAEEKLREIDRLSRTAGSGFSRSVLERLEALGAGTSTVDTAVVTDAVQSVLDDLSARRVITIASQASIASSALPHLITLVAARVAPAAVALPIILAAEAGLRASDRLSRSAGTSAIARAVIERLEALGAGSDAVDITTAAAEIDRALADLSNRRVVTIANEAAITAGQFPHTVTIIAARIQPKAVPADAVVAAEAALRASDRLSRAAGTALGRAVLERLIVLGADVAALDTTAVGAEIARTLADLSARRIIVLANEAAVSPQCWPHVVIMVAGALAPNAVPVPLIEAAELELRTIARLDRSTGSVIAQGVLERLEALGEGSDAIDLTTVTANIQTTLDDLAARRVASIANEAAVTPAGRPHVILLVAARCSPKAIPPAIMAEAEAALRLIDRLNRSIASPLVLAILEQLEIWGAGQAVIDATVVAGRIQPALDSLAARNAIYIADEDAAADMTGVQAPLVRYIAGWLAPKPMGDVVAQAESELRTLQRIGRGTGANLRVDPALRSRRPLGRLC